VKEIKLESFEYTDELTCDNGEAYRWPHVLLLLGKMMMADWDVVERQRVTRSWQCTLWNDSFLESVATLPPTVTRAARLATRI
jgi:hypothetical protein